MERDELRRRIMTQEFTSRGYEFTDLTVRFADAPDGMVAPNAVWRFEGVTGGVDDLVSDILADIAATSDFAYPPPFDLTAERSVFSWGADGASWTGALTVGSLAVNSASLIYKVVRDRIGASSVAENGAHSPLGDGEALAYARWFLASTVVDESDEPIAESEDFMLISEKHRQSRHSFEFTWGRHSYSIELESTPGHPKMVGWERRTL